VSGRLVLVGTPIGNLGDLAPRARETLQAADLVACEDTRHTGGMLARLGISARRLMSLHEHNEAARGDEILTLLAGGAVVALVSDAGMPTLSDPGARLVSLVAAAGYEVTVVPGPSAAVAALAVSGLAGERFVFEGFLPRRGGERTARLAAVAASTCPSVLYEAPARVAATLADLVGACGGERRVAVCRELTKLYEETWRGSLAEAAARARGVGSGPPRGEHVLVVDGAPPAAAAVVDPAAVAALLAERLAEGATRRDAVDAVAAELGARRRDVYETAVRLGGAGAGAAGGGGGAAGGGPHG
jgi:16S rRNA (cytidine1402-2'-O)-methyltransferase